MTFKCAHISDIHWRGLKRHEEYQIVFTALFEKLREIEPNIIFIGGDIVHSKTQGITPELIENLNWWFKSLASIAPTHVILGNHDGLILNKNRQDAITPIVEAIDSKNIFLYKKSGLYPTGIAGFNWAVFSCFDEENWCNVKPNKKEINIACFHGAVWNSKTDTDWELEGEVKLNFFEEYDFSFLGDIHKFQYLDKDKRIAYPGSTIQQNFGEDIEKGFLLWEINSQFDYNSKFIKIDNPSPYVTIDWKGSVESTIPFISKIKKGVKYRIRSNNQLTQAEIKLIHHYLKLDKRAKEIVYQTLNKEETKNKITKKLSSYDIRNNQDRKFILNSFFENLSKEEFNDLSLIFEQSLDKIPEKLSFSYGNTWTVNSLEFDNTFSYGKDNFINFKNLNGIVGLFGNNRVGKSSIPGTLMYGLFNTTDRGTIKNQNIVNTRKGNCRAKINFSVGSDNYEVERITTKKTNRKGMIGSSTDLSFKNLSEDFLLSEEQRRETEKVLRDIIGSPEDFLFTSFSSQGENSGFIKEKSSSRKNILSKFLNLDIYDELHSVSKENHIVLKSNLKKLEEKNWQKLIQEANDEIKNIKKESNETKKYLEDLKSKQIELKLEEKEISKNIDTHPSGYTKESANKKLKYFCEEFFNLEEEIKLVNSDITEIEIKLTNIEKFKNNFPISDLNSDKEKLDNFLDNLKTFSFHKKSLLKDKDNLQKEIKILDNVPCEDKFPDCKFIKNAFLAKSNIKEADSQIKNISLAIDEVNEVINKLKNQEIELKIKKYNDILKKEVSYIAKKENCILKLSHLREKYLASEKNKEKFTVLCSELETYTDELINNSHEKVKTDITEVSKNIYDVERKVHNNTVILIEINNKIKAFEKEKEEYYALIKEWKLYDLFMTAISKKGIPSMLIRYCLPKINKEIKDILHDVVNFNIEIIEEENSLNVYIDYGESKRIIECGSGMEKMIASIAVRVALINVSNLSKSDMFIIDEGFGSLDDSNVESCSRLLQSLKKFFKTILIISHVDTIKEIVDKNIEVIKKGQDSYVYTR